MVLLGDWKNNAMEVGHGRREEIGSLEILFPPLLLLFLIYLLYFKQAFIWAHSSRRKVHND